MKNNWNLTSDGLPEQMNDVLFVTTAGEIHKGFLNIRNAWLIQNHNGLISRFIPDQKSVLAWTNLPDRDDENWKTDERPESGSRILVLNRASGNVNIADVRRHVWIIRNHPKDHVTFWANTTSPWMPLPEIPDFIMKAG